MPKIYDLFALLLEILNKIMDALERERRKRNHRASQEKADNAKTDTSGAFNAHFCGMRDNATGDAPEADQTRDRGMDER